MNQKQDFHFHKDLAEKTIEKANKIANSFHQKTSDENKMLIFTSNRATSIYKTRPQYIMLYTIVKKKYNL